MSLGTLEPARRQYKVIAKSGKCLTRVTDAKSEIK
jgi:hypothetical protein